MVVAESIRCHFKTKTPEGVFINMNIFNWPCAVMWCGGTKSPAEESFYALCSTGDGDAPCLCPSFVQSSHHAINSKILSVTSVQGLINQNDASAKLLQNLVIACKILAKTFLQLLLI